MNRPAIRVTLALSLIAFAVVTPARAATLPPAPAPAQSFTIGMLHVDRYGSGPKNLILVPGLGSGPWSWYGTIAHFAPSYTIYAITLAGFDGLAATTETPLFEAFAKDFWQMLSTHHIAAPVVIGHSLGGTLAFLLAEQHPERLRAIVAADGLPVFPLLASKTAAQRAAIAQQAGATYAAAFSPAALAHYMETAGTRDPDLVAPTAKLEASSDPKAAAAWLQADLSIDLRPDLFKVSIPALEIMPFDPALGAKAGFTQDQGVAFYRSLLSGAPHAMVVSIHPSRHFVMLDQPEQFYATVGTFLDGLNDR